MDGTPRFAVFVFVALLAFLSPPVIHVAFSFFLGWKDYMPFINIPAMWQL